MPNLWSLDCKPKIEKDYDYEDYEEGFSLELQGVGFGNMVVKICHRTNGILIVVESSAEVTESGRNVQKLCIMFQEDREWSRMFENIVDYYVTECFIFGRYKRQPAKQ